MASPFSGLVLAAGVALTSPTLYAAFVVGTAPLDGAIVRLVTVVAITAVAVTLVEWLFQETSPMTETQLELSRRLAELTAPRNAASSPKADEADDADDSSTAG